MTLPRYFNPLQRADLFSPVPEEAVQKVMKQDGISRKAAVAKLDADAAKCEYWINDRYQVQVRQMGGSWVQLNIRSRDGNAIMRDWRHFQAIKNQLVGPECEAIEIYPAESRLVDATNKYHLWCNTDPTFRFPIGFEKRDVDYDDSAKSAGVKQRSF